MDRHGQAVRSRRVAALGLVLCTAAFTSGIDRSVASSALGPVADSTVVVLLGTGMPRPDPDASGPATAIVVGTRTFLFDAGAGVERRLSAARLPINGVTALFVTHLHSDHTLGLPDLIFTSWVMGRTRPMPAYGPHGLKQMIDHIVAAWSEDIAVRTNGLEHEAPHGYDVTVHEIAPGVVYDSGGVKVTAIPVLHGDWKEAYGYRVDTPTRSIVISGDTRPSPELAAAAGGVDILIHEVYPASRVAPEPRPGGNDWPRYLQTFHTSDVELGRLAAIANPKLVILQHVVGRNGATDAEMIAAVHGAGFPGRVVVGKDLQRY
jgi:ribonuclease BN (tRNA processing enzyme)